MAMRAAWNFVSLCKSAYYNGTTFHRLVPGFVLQGGDPTGTGRGGNSAFGSPFKDEFDTRILHAYRGVLSMANSGPNTNKSQFFITLNEAKHLDLKHTVFGRVVGGMAVLDVIEKTGTDRDDHPLEPIRLNATVVFNDPLDEAEALLEEQIKANIERRLARKVNSVLPTRGDEENVAGKDSEDLPVAKFARINRCDGRK
jgi:peptidyl-prolyl cis-trans isomerase-like protein 2